MELGYRLTWPLRTAAMKIAKAELGTHIGTYPCLLQNNRKFSQHNVMLTTFVILLTCNVSHVKFT